MLGAKSFPYIYNNLFRWAVKTNFSFHTTTKNSHAFRIFITIDTEALNHIKEKSESYLDARHHRHNTNSVHVSNTIVQKRTSHSSENNFLNFTFYMICIQARQR